ncbi:hypothetical protein AM218_01765 [Hymenobacter sp. DG25A]|nr:hypothetical protein AM218_01765 [Hymenobacter sp. DG25A]
MGPQVGVTLNAQFGNFSVQPSLLFSQKGFKIDYSESDRGYTFHVETSSRLNYLELPINFVYTVGGEEGFQVFAGPYAAFGISGKYNYKATLTGNGTDESQSNEADIHYSNKIKNNDNVYYRALDAGLNAGIGYKVGPVQA